MALYTGINAIKKVKSVESDILIEVPFYSEYVFDIDFFEGKGGYPSFNYILYYLNVSEDVEDTDENYYKYHAKYKSIIEKKEYYVEQINKYDLLNKYECKELCFITRRYDLAEYLQKELCSSEFYFRKIVSLIELENILTKCKDVVGINFEDTLKEIFKLKDNYDFEVHVS